MSIIRLDHKVVNVRPTGGSQRHGWEVTTRATAESDTQTERFDAVITANGHCDWPLLPRVKGLDAWSKDLPDSLYHSVSYKSAKTFENKVSKHLVGLLIHFVSWSNGLIRNFVDQFSVSFS